MSVALFRFCFAGWLAAMGVHLPSLCYNVAVLGVVFCGGYITPDTVTGIFSISVCDLIDVY